MTTDPDRRNRIRALLLEGRLRAPEIAAAQGCSPSYVRKVAEREGIALSRPGRPSGASDEHTEAIRQEAIRLHLEEGLSAAQIATQIGRSRRSVQGYLSSVTEEK